jgi:hypothetical protein
MQLGTMKDRKRENKRPFILVKMRLELNVNDNRYSSKNPRDSRVIFNILTNGYNEIQLRVDASRRIQKDDVDFFMSMRALA